MTGAGPILDPAPLASFPAGGSEVESRKTIYLTQPLVGDEVRPAATRAGVLAGDVHVRAAEGDRGGARGGASSAGSTAGAGCSAAGAAAAAVCAVPSARETYRSPRVGSAAPAAGGQAPGRQAVEECRVVLAVVVVGQRDEGDAAELLPREARHPLERGVGLDDVPLQVTTAIPSAEPSKTARNHSSRCCTVRSSSSCGCAGACG